jgi:hypothetical protein
MFLGTNNDHSTKFINRLVNIMETDVILSEVRTGVLRLDHS